MATIPPNPDWFTYTGPVMSNMAPRQYDTGGAYGSAVGSLQWWMPVTFPEALAFRNVSLFKSLAVGVPGATSQASTGSQGWSYSDGLSIFVRQNFSAQSTNLSCITTMSGGLTASLGYSGTSQRFGISWLTDGTGGTSAYTTTSSNAVWSNFVSGQKVLVMPLNNGTTLSAGEYFFAQQHSTTTATSNSNVTLLSVSGAFMQLPAIVFGVIGNSVTVTSNNQMGIGLGTGSVITTNGTMPASVITAGAQGSYWIMQFVNNV